MGVERDDGGKLLEQSRTNHKIFPKLLHLSVHSPSKDFRRESQHLLCSYIVPTWESLISSDLWDDRPSWFAWDFLNFSTESLISQETTQFQANRDD